MTYKQQVARIRNFGKFRLLGIRQSLKSLQLAQKNLTFATSSTELPSQLYLAHLDLDRAIAHVDHVLDLWDTANAELGLTTKPSKKGVHFNE